VSCLWNHARFPDCDGCLCVIRGLQGRSGHSILGKLNICSCQSCFIYIFTIVPLMSDVDKLNTDHNIFIWTLNFDNLAHLAHLFPINCEHQFTWFMINLVQLVYYTISCVAISKVELVQFSFLMKHSVICSCNLSN